VNKHRNQKYGKLPAKLAIITWEVLRIDLIGPHTLKGKDKIVIDFLCITMIDPVTSSFEIAELLISQPTELDISMDTMGHKGKDKHIQQKQPYLTNHQQQAVH
jgi:hypothetical protein